MQLTRGKNSRVDHVGLSAGDTRKYSLRRGLNAILQRTTSLETEASGAIAKRLGRAPRGLFIPAEALQVRSTVTSGALGGGNLIGTLQSGDLFVDALRDASVLRKLGARTADALSDTATAGGRLSPGMSTQTWGDVTIPTMEADPDLAWIDNESSAAPENNTTLFDQRTSSPHTISTRVPFTRKVWLQSSPIVDELLVTTVGRAMQTEFEKMAIQGDGASNRPTGILHTSGIGSSIGGTNGAAPTWSNVTALEDALPDAPMSPAYITTKAIRRTLKATETISGSGQFCWKQDSPLLNGYPAAVSGIVPSDGTKGTGTGLHSIIAGDFADLLLIYWGGLDIRPDDVTDGDRGGVILNLFLDVDVAVLRPASFAAMQDAISL